MTTILDSEAPLTNACLQFVIAVCDSFAGSSLRSPLALLILWWSLCLYFQLIVLNLIPLFFLIWFSFKWKNIKKEPQESITLSQLILKLEERLTFTAYLSWERGNARKSFIYFVSAYFIWISLQQVLTLPTLFILTGSVFIILKSEWSSPIKKSYYTMKNRFTRDKSKDSLWERVSNLEQDDQQQSTFLFEIYENQRYNLFNGQWEGTTFPFERSPWTDSVHYPVSSKSQIALPFFWNWIDEDWSAGSWSYGTIIWTTNKGNKWYHNKTRRRLWARTASTVNDGSSRRRSSVFYSQKSTVYEFPIEEKPADLYSFNNEKQDTSKEDIMYESNHIDKGPVTPPPDEKRVDSPLISLFPKPPQSPLSDDDESLTSASTDSISTCVPRAKNEYTSFYRHSKRLSSTAPSRDAIWKSITKT